SANQVSGENESWNFHNAAASSEGASAEEEGDMTPTRKTEEASRPERRLKRDAGPQRRSPVHGRMHSEEALANTPLPNRTTASSHERQLANRSGGTSVKTPKSGMRVVTR